MTKDSKTVSTIRRRRGKEVAMVLQKIREETPKPIVATEEDVAAADVEDQCYLFDNQVLGPIILRRLMSSNQSLFLALLAIRVANALLIQTQYVPDEYWQSLEVAHKMVFGYGYLTWEWREGLRGYSYPLVFAALFKVMAVLGLDSRIMLIKLPRLLQSVLAAWGDLHLYKLSSRLSGRASAQWSLLCQVLSWFTIYCCTRTLSNSSESALIIGALAYFPWPDTPSKKNDVYKFLMLAALSVIVRPTAALIWFLLCSWHLQRIYKSKMFPPVLSAYIIVGLLSLGGSSVVDRIWYGHWTFVQLNFLWFNVVRGGASIYGVHPWHWYFLQGFPVVMGTLIFPFMVGAWRAKNKALLWIMLWILATHSFLPHKEFRFILPVVPMAAHYCGVYFQMLCHKPPLKKFRPSKKGSEAKESSSPSDPLGTPQNTVEEKPEDHKEKMVSTETAGDTGEATHRKCEEMEEPGIVGFGCDAEVRPTHKSRLEDEKQKMPVSDNEDHVASKAKLKTLLEDEVVEEVKETNPETLRTQAHQHNLRKAKLLVSLLAITNVLPALYFCLLHQRGTVMVTKFLHQAAISNPRADVLFLMPCHSTPYYSYLHSNISMRFLTCEPNLNAVTNYTDEADLFYQNPESWLKSEYILSKQPWPSHIVYFNTLHRHISAILIQSGYKLCENFFHTHWPDGRVGQSVLVSCR